MGVEMPGDVAKGELMAFLDDLLSTKQGRAEFKRIGVATRTARGSEAKRNVEVLKRLKVGRGLREHVDKHFFAATGDDAFWANTPGIESWPLIIRGAYRQALELADDGGKKGGLPIVTLWLCPGTDMFQAMVTRSDNQITVMLVTPHREQHERWERRWAELSVARGTETENLWVIGDQDYIEEASGGVAPVLAVRQDVTTRAPLDRVFQVQLSRIKPKRAKKGR